MALTPLSLLLVVILLNLVLHVLVAEAASSSLAPVYLKFHKVGSATVNSILSEAFSTPWWACRSTPFSHDVLFEYKKLNGNMTSCIKQVNDTHTLTPVSVALLRDPLERIISQCSFFYRALENGLKKSFVENKGALKGIFNESNVIETGRRIRTDPSSISPPEIGVLLEILGNYSHLFDPNLHIREYENTFSGTGGEMRKQRELGRLNVAKENMKKNIRVIGVTEWMSSFMFELSSVLDFDVRVSCGVHDTHGAKPRPPVEKVFHPNTVAEIRKKASREIELWEYAKELHLDQLSMMNMHSGMSMIQITEKYDKICDEEIEKQKNIAKKKKNAKEDKKKDSDKKVEKEKTVPESAGKNKGTKRDKHDKGNSKDKK